MHLQTIPWSRNYKEFKEEILVNANASSITASGFVRAWIGICIGTWHFSRPPFHGTFPCMSWVHGLVQLKKISVSPTSIFNAPLLLLIVKSTRGFFLCTNNKMQEEEKEKETHKHSCFAYPCPRGWLMQGTHIVLRKPCLGRIFFPMWTYFLLWDIKHTISARWVTNPYHACSYSHPKFWNSYWYLIDYHKWRFSCSLSGHTCPFPPTPTNHVEYWA